ncbi:MAG: PAS domain S-box protein [Acidobacteriaceae bacterium]
MHETDRANAKKTEDNILDQKPFWALGIFAILAVAGIMVTSLRTYYLANSLSSAQRDGLLFSLFLSTILRVVLVVALLLILRSYLHFRRAKDQLHESLKFQQSILDSTAQIVMACDLEGNLLVFNQAAERMLGYRTSEMLGKPRLKDTFPAGEMERVGKRLWASMGRQGELPDPAEIGPLRYFLEHMASMPVDETCTFERIYQRADGSIFTGSCALSAIHNVEGKMTGLLAVVSDISAQKHAEDILRESEERYRDLFEHSNELISTLTPQGRYLYVNPAWQKHLTQRASSFQGQLFEIIFPEESRPEMRDLFQQMLDGRPVERLPLKLNRWDGSLMDVEASLSCRKENDVPVSVRCIFRDITDQVARERRLALQAAVSEIVASAKNGDEAFAGVQEAIVRLMNWDLTDLWMIGGNRDFLYHRYTFTAPNKNFPEFIRDSNHRVFCRNQGLPGRIWERNAAVWIEDIHDGNVFLRHVAAMADGLFSGWGFPIRVGNEVIATMQFYSQQRRKRDPELMSTVETICSSLGQFLVQAEQEKQVNELNRQKESVLNAVADGIFGTNSEGHVAFVNPAAARMLGASIPELVGRPVHEIVHEHRDDGESCTERCRILRALLGRESNAGQDVFFRKNGGGFAVDFSVTPMKNQGIITGVVISFRDISQRRELERMKDEFISTVSHELRTPLTSIRGALGLLSAGLLGEINPKASNLLRIAVSNTDRLVRLINDILDLERMASGRAPLHFRRCNLRELVQQAVETMTAMADAAQVKLVIDAVAVNLDADSDRILQVLTNLLSNAIKFSPAESIVQVSVEIRQESLLLKVMDEGRGIPADKLESVFDRFQQVDASDSRQKGGTGLGLAICRSIIQQHGGRIWAEQNVDQGTTFCVSLPRTHAESAIAVPMRPPEKEKASATVLVCDDDAGIRTIVSEHLRRHGYTVVEAERGEQALALANELPVEAILLDLYMPGLSGWETLQRLKNDKATAEIPVVILSVLSPTERPVLAEDAAGWVQKPFNENLLLNELGRVLHGSDDPGHVLLVEDDLDLAQVVIASFEQAGIQVAHATTRRDAIEMCRHRKPDLMILDLTLPDGDGFSVVDWLRRQPEFRTLPLVVYSGREVSDREMRQLRLGPTQFLTKARVQPEEVEALVLTMVRQFQDRKEPLSQSSAPAPGTL